ncbi:MAG TPA: DUF4232 domain-containing protein [Candidatus Elarobacter sp.]|jgi:hypothetical protein|nr:DUF4232 domain-containing protein [Candidatus Elarobacter sp.]
MGYRPLAALAAALAALGAGFAALPAAAASPAPASAPPIAGGPHALAILRPCAASQLRAAVISDEGAMLHRELRIGLTNTGTTGCAIDGYPAVRLLDELKHPRIVAETFSTEKPREFTIGPGQAAVFRLRVATGDGTTTYMTAPTLAIIPPGDVAPLLLNVQLPVAPTLEVMPLIPAAAAK